MNPQTTFLVDPMCGSGSSLVAAKQTKIDSVGLDVNGYAVLASRVKGAAYQESDLILIRRAIDRFNRTSCASGSVSEYCAGIEKYFRTKNLETLCAIRGWIEHYLAEQKIKDFFMLALLAILEDCSDRKKDGNGLATRPSPVDDPKFRMSEQLALMYEDVATLTCQDTAISIAIDHSALELASAVKEMEMLLGKKLGSIIFSPPYANSFDYFESYKLELIFGGYSTLEDLGEARKRLVRNYRIRKPKLSGETIEVVEALCEEILERIPEKESETGVRDGRTRLVPNMLRGYFEDMDRVIQEGYKSLSEEGMMHIVVDQSAYVGVPIPTDLLLALLGSRAGFKVASVINCRRANTSAQQLRKFPYLRHLLRESIVSLRK